MSSPYRSPTAAVRKLYLASYANAKYWVDYEDFSFYRMEVVDVYYVGGFGVMGWISASEYKQAQPDPLADVAAEILEHMNTDHKDALILLAREFAGIEAQEAAMNSVDRLGFHLRLKTQDGVRGVRIALGTRRKPERSSWKWCNGRSDEQAFRSPAIFCFRRCGRS